jgi:hypothetical protein
MLHHNATDGDSMSKNTGKLILAGIVNGVPVPLLDWSGKHESKWPNLATAEKWCRDNQIEVVSALQSIKSTSATWIKVYYDDSARLRAAEVFKLSPEKELQRDWDETFNKFLPVMGADGARTIANVEHAPRIAKLGYVPVGSKKPEEVKAKPEEVKAEVVSSEAPTAQDAA